MISALGTRSRIYNSVILRYAAGERTREYFLQSLSTPRLSVTSASSSNVVIVVTFYRAMHFSAKRGIAIACRLSVRLSVCNVGEL